MSDEQIQDATAEAVAVVADSGRDCHICHRPTGEEGEKWCSYPHPWPDYREHPTKNAQARKRVRVWKRATRRKERRDNNAETATAGDSREVLP